MGPRIRNHHENLAILNSHAGRGLFLQWNINHDLVLVFQCFPEEFLRTFRSFPKRYARSCFFPSSIFAKHIFSLKPFGFKNSIEEDSKLEKPKSVGSWLGRRGKGSIDRLELIISKAGLIVFGSALVSVALRLRLRWDIDRCNAWAHPWSSISIQFSVRKCSRSRKCFVSWCVYPSTFTKHGICNSYILFCVN